MTFVSCSSICCNTKSGISRVQTLFLFRDCVVGGRRGVRVYLSACNLELSNKNKKQTFSQNTDLDSLLMWSVEFNHLFSSH